MKKFWTYIKHKRKDNIGISSLMMDLRFFSSFVIPFVVILNGFIV
jgi:hypothetical protein